jgi:uncharacterized membrane protein
MTAFVFALLGGIIGAVVLQEFGGFVLGAFSGAVAGLVSDLAGRVRTLERRLDAQRAGEARAAGRAARETAVAARAAAEPESPAAAQAPAAMGAAGAPAAPASVPAAAPEPELAVPLGSVGAAEPVAEPSRSREGESTPAAARAAPRPSLAELARARRAAALPSAVREESAFSAFVATVLRWFTTGNVPVKAGVVLSVFGVGFLVKEGIDRHWLVLPLEFRLALVALFGVALLVLGWRLRHRQRTYALSVQGGGIAVLYLTTYASFAIYQLLPGPLAFGVLVLVTAGVGALAVLQDSRSLAVLGIVGGFMAPVLTSTDSGNHVALFGYYAILNVAILGIAWFKSWRVLNVLGFAFTFGIGALWGADGYTPEKFATTEPFLVLFVLFYLAIPVLFATRQAPELRGFVDGTLVFGTPIVGFALQSRLVANTEYGLALSAVALAAIYVVLATFLYRRRREEVRVLVEAQLALAVAFVTVAIPLALDARWTSAAWALQGAALVWLGFRQRRRLALVAGVGLQILSGVEYFDQAPSSFDWPVLNGACLGALLLAFAGAFSAHRFEPSRVRRATDLESGGFGTLMAVLLLAWAVGWWLLAGFVEVDRAVVSRFELAAGLLFVAATSWLALGVSRQLTWPRMDWTAVLLWPIAICGAALAAIDLQHPAEALGWLAWPAVITTMLGVLRARDERFPRLGGALHVTAYWLAVALLAWEVHWQVGTVAGGAWPDAAMLASAAVVVLLTLRLRERIAWPIAAHADRYLRAACGGVVAVLSFAVLAANFFSRGDALPLPYVPLVNPLELACLLVLVAALRWRRVLEAEGLATPEPVRRAVAAGVFLWLLVTMAVARTVSHWNGVPFDFDSLAASTTFQSALSIVWGVAGLSAMLVGTRTARRLVWLAGAVLMAVVVAKLFLVDLGNTGTLARVVSFLGVGVLLLVVGYFAPVPPRARARAAAEQGSNS